MTNLEKIKELGGQIEGEIVEFSFYENVSNNGGESITLPEAIEIESKMMELGFAGGLIGSTFDESDWTVLRFSI